MATGDRTLGFGEGGFGTPQPNRGRERSRGISYGVEPAQPLSFAPLTVPPPTQQFQVSTLAAGSGLTQEERQGADASFSSLCERVANLEQRMGLTEGVVSKSLKEDAHKFEALLHQTSNAQQ